MHAWAGKAVYEGVGEWLHLTLSPRVEDGGLELTADKVDVSQQSGDAFAHGNVKATWTSQGATAGDGSAGGQAGQGNVALGGQGPAHVIAEEAQLHQPTGEATFRGHARLWQQANSVSGPLIVLDRQKQTLVAGTRDPADPVKAVLLERTARLRHGQSGGGNGRKTATPSVIRVRGGDLWYSDTERRAVMHGGVLGAVVAETGTATSTSNQVELQLTPAGNRDSNNGGQAQVDRMTATGRVTLTSQGRRGTGEQLVYSGATGDYVLTGTASTPPKMTDPEQGTVTGEALIFHSRDDSVSIEGGGRETTTETTAPRAPQKVAAEASLNGNTDCRGNRQELQGKAGGPGRGPEDLARRGGGTAGAERRRQDDQLLHHRGTGGARERARAGGRHRDYAGCRCTCARATSASATCPRSLRSSAS